MGDDDRIEDEVDEQEGSGEEVKGSTETSKIVKILMFVAGGILFVILVSGISYIIVKNVKESSYEKSQDIVAQPPPPALKTFELPSFSKTTSDAEPHFLKVKLSLGYDKMNVKLNNELVSRKDEIQHIINMILQGKKYEELRSESDVIFLAEEIKSHINLRLIFGKIKEVYFISYVVN
jgi:flagellar protein FliL